jgi:hypothetical protein
MISGDISDAPLVLIVLGSKSPHRRTKLGVRRLQRTVSRIGARTCVVIILRRRQQRYGCRLSCCGWGGLITGEASVLRLSTALILCLLTAEAVDGYLRLSRGTPKPCSF